MTKATYSDIDLTFAPHPLTGDIVKKYDSGAIIQSIKNIVLTAEEEILMEPNIGGGGRELLFDINDGLFHFKMKQKITETITLHENRCELKDVIVSVGENGKAVFVKVVFFILNNPVPVTEIIHLKRLR